MQNYSEMKKQQTSIVNGNSQQVQMISLNIEQLQDMFSGDYQQESCDLARFEFRAINTNKACLMPYRIKSCNKLRCIFDKKALQKQQQVQCCSQKNIQKAEKLILDWRLYTLILDALKSNVFNPQDRIQIVVHNSRIALINLTKGLEAYQRAWQKSGYDQTLSETKNIIKDILKQEIYRCLLNERKVGKDLKEIKQFLSEIKTRKLAEIGQKISQADLLSNDFNSRQKKCLFYVENKGQKSYIYFFQRLQQRNSQSLLVPYQIEYFEGRNGNSVKDAKWFKNNNGVLHSIGSDQWIYRYVMSEGRKFVEQRYAYDEKLAQISKNTQLVYVAQNNILYLIGGQGNCVLSYINFEKVIEGKPCLVMAKNRSQLQITRCKAVFAGDNQIYIIKQDQDDNNFVTVYYFKPTRQSKIQKLEVAIDQSQKHLIFQPQALLTTVLDSGEPCILLICSQLKQNCETVMHAFKGHFKGIPMIFQDCSINVCCQPFLSPKTYNHNLVNDYAGMIMINSSRYLIKFEANLQCRTKPNQEQKVIPQICQIAIFIREGIVHIEKITL